MPLPDLLLRAVCATALSALAAGGCHARPPPIQAAPQVAVVTAVAPVQTGDRDEPPPSADLFRPEIVASLFSFPRPLVRAPAELGPEWKGNGTMVWAQTYASGDDTFAKVTLVLFDGRYRGMTLDDRQRNLLRLSDAYHDLDFGGGRAGYVMLAQGDTGALETATLPSPRGRYELLVVVELPKGGPKEGPGSEAYRSLIMGYPVKLLESVARGIDELWSHPKGKAR
jgi:hypothetical protein